MLSRVCSISKVILYYSGLWQEWVFCYLCWIKEADMNDKIYVMWFHSHLIYMYTHTHSYIYDSALNTLLNLWGENFDPQILSWAHVTGSSITCIMVTLPLPFSEVLADQLYISNIQVPLSKSGELGGYLSRAASH